jgi:putative nucleotidyltransferase with HDIG domain
MEITAMQKRPQAAEQFGTETDQRVQREALALEVIRSLQSRGHKALLVGGCVRDRLLGIEPQDYDVSTDATPHQISSYFPESQQVGAHFGVVLVTRSGGVQVEVATFRTDGRYSDGRRPDKIHFERDPELDARRRDFTVNALMEDPLSGEVFDFVGGRADLAHGTIRAIGNAGQRFEEDFLRMLRAVRFAARLDFSIEPHTLAAIQEHASCITKISAERIRDELGRMLTEGHPRRALELLDESLLLEQVLPEIKALQGVQQPPEFHPEGDVWTHVLIMLGELRDASLTLALGVLLHDVGKPPTFLISDRIRFNGHAEVGAELSRRILERLKFNNEEIEQVTALVANHMRFKDVQHMRLSTLKRFLCLPHFGEHLELHRLDCLASNGFTSAYEFVRQKLVDFREEELRPPRLLTGSDLIDAGYKPGPGFRNALEAVETGQLEGEIQNREQALELARSVLDKAAA